MKALYSSSELRDSKEPNTEELEGGQEEVATPQDKTKQVIIDIDSDPNFDNFEIDFSTKLKIFFLDMFEDVNCCSKHGSVELNKLKEQIELAQESLEDDYNIKNIVRHIKINRKLNLINKEVIQKNRERVIKSET